jgi:serine-type D-Ala-D-Ala carboxypeptidase/endopeptidase
MSFLNRRLLGLVTIVVATCAACAPGPGVCNGARAVCSVLDERAPSNGAFLTGTGAEGRDVTWSRGSIDEETPMQIASATKWLASATVMTLVDDGTLSLDDRASKWLPFWATDADDPRSEITLRHLLSFTAGFRAKSFDASCAGNNSMTLEECARKYHDESHVDAPGTTYFYGPAPLQIAGAIVERASERPFDDVFRERVADVVGMSEDATFGREKQNPLLAGGARARPSDYEKFLRALLDGTLLPAQQEAMDEDNTPVDDVVIAESPVEKYGQAWHYALGHWRECAAEEWQATCDDEVIVSSPGAWGFYPWIDRARGTYGIMAADGLFDLDVSVNAVRAVRPLLP